MADRREASPRGVLTLQQPTKYEAGANAPRLTPNEQTFWQSILDRASSPAPLEDPVSYPVTLLGMTEDFIQSGRGPNHEEARAKITPMRGSIRNIKTAYDILAHPRCKWSERDAIEGDLALDSSLHERDRVTLNDKEAMILGALTRITKIPFDEKKRAYLYSEVVHSPDN